MRTQAIPKNTRVHLFVFFFFFVLIMAIKPEVQKYFDARTEDLIRNGVDNNQKLVPIQDFYFILYYSKVFLTHSDIRFYTPEIHRWYCKEVLHLDVSSAMSFAYSPIMPLLMAPLLLFNTINAWFVWCLIGSYLVAVGIKKLSQKYEVSSLLPCLLILSPCTYINFTLGQTALFTTGLLMALIYIKKPDKKPMTLCISSMIVFILAMKPPLAILAGVGLLLSGHWKPVLIASLLTACVIVATQFHLGSGWISDYILMVKNFNQVDCDEMFRAGYEPRLMSSLRGFLFSTSLCNDSVAYKISNALYLGLLAVVGCYAMCMKPKLDRLFSFSLLSIIATLFTAHLTSTEDIVLIIPLVFFITARPDFFRNLGLFIAFMIPFVGGSTIAMFRLDINLFGCGLAAIAFVLKVVLAFCFFWVARRNKDSENKYKDMMPESTPQNVARC